MNISELVGKKLPEIKKLLFSETTEEAFVDAKLVDGTIVYLNLSSRKSLRLNSLKLTR
jgi:hypothetical protein